MTFCILKEKKLHTKAAWKLNLLIKLYFKSGLEYTFALNTVSLTFTFFADLSKLRPK